MPARYTNPSTMRTIREPSEKKISNQSQGCPQLAAREAELQVLNLVKLGCLGSLRGVYGKTAGGGVVRTFAVCLFQERTVYHSTVERSTVNTTESHHRSFGPGRRQSH